MDGIKLETKGGKEDSDLRGKIKPSLDILLFADAETEINWLTECLGKEDKERKNTYDGGKLSQISFQNYVKGLYDNTFWERPYPYDTISAMELSNKHSGIYNLTKNLVEDVCKLNLISQSEDADIRIKDLKNDFINSLNLDSTILNLKKALFIAQNFSLKNGTALNDCTVMYGFSFESKEEKNKPYEQIFNDRVKGGKFRWKKLGGLKNELTEKLGEKIYSIDIHKNKIYYLSPYL